MAVTREEMIRILAEADPVGLIKGGHAPEEYAAEADAILAAGDRWHNPELKEPAE